MGNRMRHGRVPPVPRVPRYLPARSRMSTDYGWKVPNGCATCGGDIEVSSRTGDYIHSYWPEYGHPVTRPRVSA
jgi:hypothetical protein